MNAQTAAREIWSRLGDDSVAHCLPSAWIEELIQQAIDEAVKEERARYVKLAEKWLAIAPEMEERTTYLILAHELKSLTGEP